MPKVFPAVSRTTRRSSIRLTVVSKSARMEPSLTRFSMSGLSQYFTLAPNALLRTAIVTRTPFR